ncbi:TPA: hypothetical protein N2D16_002909 [Clostridium botulinum]|nr:hypothetical protein [Clostridium botulinum]HCL4455288.1 hypothetical protein [Clostridium botulinum]
MKKYESLGITTIVTKDKLKIEIPIKNLVNGFNLNPENYDESKVAKGKRQEFANYVAKALINSSNADTGDSLIMETCDRVFEDIMEGCEDFIKYSDENE